MTEGLREENLHVGPIRFNAENRKEAWVTVPALVSEVLVVGLDQNRAFEGDCHNQAVSFPQVVTSSTELAS